MRRPVTTHATPSYGATSRAGTRTAQRVRSKGAARTLGIAIPETDENSVVGWRGRVIRVDELSDTERVRIGGRTRADMARQKSESIWFCHGCRSWSAAGARCRWCGDVRPAA